MRLHKTKGLNPRLTTCPRCAKEGQSILLLGNHDKKGTCPSCGITIIGIGRKCPKCGTDTRSVPRQPIGDTDMIPQICDTCVAEINREQYEVKAGGIFFKCKKCNATGVVRKEVSLAIKVRKELNLKPPLPCGIELSNCSLCRGSGV